MFSQLDHTGVTLVTFCTRVDDRSVSVCVTVALPTPTQFFQDTAEVSLVSSGGLIVAIT